MIVALESIDAGGKGTQATFLRDRLLAAGTPASVFKFPCYESVTGGIIRDFLRGGIAVRTADITKEVGGYYSLYPHVNALTLQALQTANKYEQVDRLRAAAGDRKSVLILDRYWLSAVAYGVADGLDEAWLVDLHRALPQPDLWLYLDITVEESFRRRPKRDDAYEADRGRLERAREVYCRSPLILGRSAVSLDGMLLADAVLSRIWDHVSKIL